MIPTLLLFFASTILAPWWLTVAVGLLLLSRWNAVFSVILGGVILDLVLGTSVSSLSGFQYVYTCVFILCALASTVLRATMLE